MNVNIVMVSRSRHLLVHQSIRTLYRNTAKEMFNLTIVDDESAIPPEPHNKPNFTMLRVTHSKHILGQLKNLGITWADMYWGRGDYLYLSDNDVYFTPNWLEKLIAAYESYPDMGILGGWNHPYHQDIDVFDNIHFQNTLAGPSMLMTWENWDAYGPFPQMIPGVCQGEDVALCDRMIARALKVGTIVPHVVISTGVKNSDGELAPGADRMVDELRSVGQTYRDIFWD